MSGPLQGVRVLAVERNVAGPYGSMILGDLGAEVIKIEPPGGEQIRLVNVPPYHKGEPALFLAFNRNKKGMVLDLRTETGLQAFYDLVKVSDVVWDNNRQGVMERLKADYEILKQINSRIICCSITGYGSSGPYATWPSYDIVAQGMAGILMQTGQPGGPPTKPAPSLGDLSGGLFGALGVISALWQRERTGEGQKVEMNILDGAMALMCMHYAIYFLDGVVPPPVGAGHLQAVPFGAYKTKDGWLTIGNAWPRVARTLGIEWIIDDPRFSTVENRLKNREELNAIVTEATEKLDTQTWLELLRADDISAGPVYNLDQAPDDPQVKHNKMIVGIEHSLGGQIRQLRNPIRMPSIRTEDYKSPPTLGQHTYEVLSAILGYSEDQIAKLEQEQQKHRAELEEHYHRLL
ncbi:MAG: CoA transferase [Chloroflexota bacterium]|nr:CoA transferase [Chloroflexota bacterium]